VAEESKREDGVSCVVNAVLQGWSSVDNSQMTAREWLSIGNNNDFGLTSLIAEIAFANVQRRSVIFDVVPFKTSLFRMCIFHLYQEMDQCSPFWVLNKKRASGKMATFYRGL